MEGCHSIYVLFNSISVISGRREVDNEKLCAMELPFPVEKKRLMLTPFVFLKRNV